MTRRRRSARRRPAACALAPLGGLVAAALLLTSCGTVKAAKSLFGGTLPIEVRVSPDANQDSPIAVTLVVAYNKKTANKLLELSASDWFADPGQLQRDYRKDIQAWSWEWVPGHQGEIVLQFRSGAKRGVVYADYLSPGKHRLAIDLRRPIRLRFEADGFLAEPVE